MRITQRTTQDITVLDLDGKLTTDKGADLLSDKILSLFSQGQSKVVLNLAGVPQVDSRRGSVSSCVVTWSRNGRTAPSSSSA